MSFPHRDDSAAAVARRPNNNHHAAVQETKREKSFLSLPIGRDGQCRVGKHLPGKRHVQAAVLERYKK
jgi:hypothetical protein